MELTRKLQLQLNTSREVISRLLKNLEKNNYVVIERNSVDYTGLVKNLIVLCDF